MDPYYWLAFTHLQGIGPIRIRRWLEHFHDIKNLFFASEKELQSIGLTPKQIFSIKKVDWRQVDRDRSWCEKNHCQLISLHDPHYPVLLREIPDAPLLLFVFGDVNLLSTPQLAMVGSRHPTKMGLEIAQQFACSLAQSGLTITSGLALGIDGASHRGALSANGKTIAVVGTGLQHIYPQCHRQLAQTIMAKGAVVSEFSPAQEAKAQHFPMRNRVISGMSLGVLVVEAAIQSGSLITARFAMEQNREVFAIPGSIHNPLTKGCHQLISQGAKLIQSVEDILEEIGMLQSVVKPEIKSSDLSKELSEMLACIGDEVTSLDVICLRSHKNIPEVSSLLLALELEGWIARGVGGYMRKSI